MSVTFLLILLLIGIIIDVGESVSLADTPSASLQSYLQQESLLLSDAQRTVTEFLLSKQIPIRSSHLTREERRRKKDEESQNQVRVCVSSEDNEVECRISLDRVEIGKKCVAPCGCVGSQRWIQFSEFNRLRRKEPSKWVTCQTCQQKFDYSILNAGNSDVKTHILSTLLDKPAVLRSVLGLIALVTSYLVSLDQLTLRLLTSRFFWQRYKNISKLVHLPLVLKLWGGRVVLQYVAQFYVRLEGALVDNLCALETESLEKNLTL